MNVRFNIVRSYPRICQSFRYEKIRTTAALYPVMYCITKSARPVGSDYMVTSTEQATFPDGLSSTRAKLVYLYVVSAERASAADVAESLAMTRMTALTILGSLCDGGRIQKHGEVYAPA